MIFEDMNPQEFNSYITELLSKNKPITSKDKLFNEYFELNQKNILCKKDSIIVIDNNIRDNYEDEGSYFTGIPMFYLISFKDINDKDSEVVILEVKIPFRLDVMYTKELEDVQGYKSYYLESQTNLFKSNMSEQNVDNSYQAVKELLDGKFNLMRKLNYEDIPLVLSDICSKNSIKGFQLLVYELLTMSLSRELNNKGKEFRFTAKKNNPANNFQMINVRNISRTNSAFSALASENISASILTALDQPKKEKENAIITPQEQIALGKF